MFQVPSLVVLLGLGLCLLSSHKTIAQEARESGVVYEAGRNKIGLIRYCHKQGLLDQTTADGAITAMEAGLRKLSANIPRDGGERAQQAGEDGYWDVARKHDLASIAKLFSTTPKDLCHEWAGDTLRAQAPTPRATTGAHAQPEPPKPASAERAQGDRAATAALPKAPPSPKGVHKPSSAKAATKPSGQDAPASTRVATKAEEARPRGQADTAGTSARDPDDRPHAFWLKWPFSRLGKTGRCLMPGCKWQDPQGAAQQP